MKKKKIYLDSCIFIKIFTKEQDYQKIGEFLSDPDIEFVTSDWTWTEIVKVLIKTKKVSEKKVSNYIQSLLRMKKIEGIRFDIISVSPEKDYTFEEFFYEVQKTLLKYKGSLGDVLHSVIMKNNKIDTILSTDSEFEGMKGIYVINPLKSNLSKS
jgi:predicted nucleic acid-binding protein